METMVRSHYTWILFAQHRLPYPKRLSKHLCRLLVLVLTTQHIRQVVYPPQLAVVPFQGRAE